MSNTDYLVNNAAVKYLTIDQVAKILQVPKSWVYEKTRKRHSDKNPIPCYLLGRHIRFIESEIDGWVLSLPSSLKFKEVKKRGL